MAYGPVSLGGYQVLIPATEGELGGIKVGNNLIVTDDGTLSANIITDKTLTQSDVPADAFTVGEEIGSKLSLSGGTMTGGIRYKGPNGESQMISFMPGGDNYGQGIRIGGGGLTIVGGGESAATYESTLTDLHGGTENLVLCNDGVIDFYTNCQSGMSSAIHTTIDRTGSFSGKVNGFTFKAQTSDPGANSTLATGTVLFVYS